MNLIKTHPPDTLSMIMIFALYNLIFLNFNITFNFSIDSFHDIKRNKEIKRELMTIKQI
jgi:hypothetical protein